MKPLVQQWLIVGVMSLPGMLAASSMPVLRVDLGRHIEPGRVQAVLADFSRRHRIKVELVRPALGSFDGYADIVCTSHEQLGSALEHGHLQVLTPSAHLYGNFASAWSLGWDAVTIKGSIYAYPLLLEPMALVYNPQLLSHPPRSFSELPALAQGLRVQHGVQALVWNYTDAYLTWPLLAAADKPSIFPANANGEFDPRRNGASYPGVIDGAITIRQWLDQGSIGRIEAGIPAETVFMEGRAAMLLAGRDSWPRLRHAGVPWALAPWPELGGNKPPLLLSVWGCSITRTADSRAARTFMEQFLLSASTQKLLFGRLRGVIPLHARLFADATDHGEGRILWEQVLASRPTPNHPLIGRFWSEMGSALKNIMRGAPPADTLQRAHRRIGGEP